MSAIRQLNSSGVVLSVINLETAPSTLSFGRDKSNDIVLVDPRVSRIHTLITRRNGRYVISDNNSRNGTWVNDSTIREYFLKDGDTFNIGSGRFMYEETDAPPVVIKQKAPVERHPYFENLSSRLSDDLARTEEFPLVRPRRTGRWVIGVVLLACAGALTMYLWERYFDLISRLF